MSGLCEREENPVTIAMKNHEGGVGVDNLQGKTMFISGASRGIGLAIAKRAARDGANVALIAKTGEPHSRLPGTVFTAAKEIEEAGGRALPIVGDIRFDEQVEAAVVKAVEAFAGIDLCVNNASAISLAGVSDLPMKTYDLMQDINTRGAYLVSRACLPHLIKSENPHILTLSPPINLKARWFRNHTAYTISKYGMSMCTIGMAAELASRGVAVNSLWPRTIIGTAAIQMLGGQAAMQSSRRPEIMADAAHAILCRTARETSGNFFIDDEVLAEEGVTDLSSYAFSADSELQTDIFLDS